MGQLTQSAARWALGSSRRHSPYTREYKLCLFHLNGLLELAKVIYGRNRISTVVASEEDGDRTEWKETQKHLLGAMAGLYILTGDWVYTGECVCQNSSRGTLNIRMLRCTHIWPNKRTTNNTELRTTPCLQSGWRWSTLRSTLECHWKLKRFVGWTDGHTCSTASMGKRASRSLGHRYMGVHWKKIC